MNDVESVVFIIDCLYGGASGGTEKQFVRLMQACVELDVQPTIVFLQDRPVQNEIHWPSDPEILELKSLKGFRLLRVLPRLSGIINSASATSIQSFFDDAAIVCACLTILRSDMRFICSQRNMGDERSLFKRWIFRWVYRRAQRIAVNSSGIRDRLIHRYHVPADKIEIVDNLIEDSNVRTTDASDILVDTIQSLRSDCDALVISIANLRTIKGVEDLINAARLIPEDTIVKIAIVGDGPERERFQQMIDSLDLRNRVHLLGYQHNAADVLTYADIAVLASHSEGGSNALIEYMLAGVPIIATKVGGNCDFIQHGKTGLLVPAKDPDELADAIVELTSNPKRAKIFGDRAKEYARARFSRKKVLAGHYALYHQRQ